jgi:DNA-binding GntR family transcriptional regulator
MSETNRDFHLVIAAAGRNRYLQSVAYQLSIQGMRLSWIWYDNFATGDPNQDIERTILEHDLIVDAIEARDAEQAERLAYQHVEAFRRRLIEQLGATLGRAVKIAPGHTNGR